MTQITDLSESDIAYINGQIQKLKSGRYNSDDCLGRIASCANLIHSPDEVGDDNRDAIEQRIEEFQLAQ